MTNCRDEDCHVLKRALHYQYSWSDLEHLQIYQHPTKQCRYGEECRAFLRLICRGDRVGDQTHMRVFDHPALSDGEKRAIRAANDAKDSDDE